MTPPIRTRSSKVVYENPWMRVREDAIERPGGRPGVYAVIEKPQAALVMPFDGEHLHLVGQWRYTVARDAWEFPQGALHEVPDAAGETVARQELLEETGFVPGRLLPLGRFTFAVGMSNQWCDAFLALDLVPGEAQPEPEEEGLLHARAVTVDEFEGMVRAGEVWDAATIAAWGLAMLDPAARAALGR
ncbi:MAG: NUDIX hydrolase [Solirubrobacteraceae bacterium]|nr:NUDIX hydrolase [Solirubrobacteraceae bacterium]